MKKFNLIFFGFVRAIGISPFIVYFFGFKTKNNQKKKKIIKLKS